MENREPPIMFRPPAYIIEILKLQAKKWGISENLTAKFFMIDQMISLKLIPEKLIPDLIIDAKLEGIDEIKKAYNFSDSEIKNILKQVEEKQNAH